MISPPPNADTASNRLVNVGRREQGDSALDTLIEAAVLAPSGDNTQPWRFIVDRDRHAVMLDVDPTRDPSPMNAGQRMARVSLGMALESMIRTAEANGWSHTVEDTPPRGLVAIRLERDTGAGKVHPSLGQRVSNRRVYAGRELEPGRSETLRMASARQVPNVWVSLITDPGERSRLVDLIARADAFMLSNRQIRDAFLAKVRFDAPVDEPVGEGLSLGSLEISAVDRLFMRLLNAWSAPDRLLRALGARRTFAAVARKLASSASGFGVITTEGTGPATDLHVGQAWQNLWMQFAEEGLASQPMMSLPVLDNILENGDSELFTARDLRAIRKLLDEFRSLVARFAEGRPAVVCRFGYADPPSSHVGRLSSDRFVEEVAT